MSFLKNMTIKSVTRKRTRHFISLIEAGLNAEEFYHGDMDTRISEILKKLIETIENQENAGSLNIDFAKIDNSIQLLFCIVVQAVRIELSYDKSVGDDKDYLLMESVFKKEFERWKKRASNNMNKLSRQSI